MNMAAFARAAFLTNEIFPFVVYEYIAMMLIDRCFGFSLLMLASCFLASYSPTILVFIMFPLFHPLPGSCLNVGALVHARQFIRRAYSFSSS